MPTIETSDASVAAWLCVNDLPFLHVDGSRGPRARFVFDDTLRRADALLAEFLRDERLGRLPIVRGRFLYLLDALRRSGRTSISAAEFDAASRSPLQRRAADL